MALKIPATHGRFFSVKLNVTILGMKYRPNVCYKLTRELTQTVEEMAKTEDHLARIYDEEVRFVSGIAYPINKPKTVQSAPVATAPAVESDFSSSASAEVDTSGHSGKKRSGRREFE